MFKLFGIIWDIRPVVAMLHVFASFMIMVLPFYIHELDKLLYIPYLLFVSVYLTATGPLIDWLMKR